MKSMHALKRLEKLKPSPPISQITKKTKFPLLKTFYY